MCGILYIENLRGRELRWESLDVAEKLMRSRGPEATISRMSRDKQRYFVNAILPINPGHTDGVIKFPNIGSDVFAYNGELFDFSVDSRGSSGSPTDTFHAHKLVANGRFVDLLKTPGFFSFIFRNSIDDPAFELVAGTDLFGQKSLFYHFGDNFLLVSSTPEPIVSFLFAEQEKTTVNRDFVVAYLASRNMIIGAGSFFNEVSRLPSGRIFRFSVGSRSVVPLSPEVFEIVREDAGDPEGSGTAVQEEIDRSFAGLRSGDVASAFSGGVDSSIVAGRLIKAFGDRSIPAITLDFGEKDLSAAATHQMAKSLKLTNHVFHRVTSGGYTEAFRQIIPGACAPLPTHSTVSSFIVNQLAASEGRKVLFGGAGGDEIFGGYATYRTMTALDSENSISEYSSFRREGAFFHCFDGDNWRRLQKLQSISAAKDSLLSWGFSRPDASLKSSQWLDIQSNLQSTEFVSGDWLSGKFGIENRSPLVSLSGVKGALFSRQSIGADGKLLDKPGLRAEYSRLFGAPPSASKYGFSGFPNEAGLEILDGQDSPVRVRDFLGEILPNFSDPGISRREAWKIMNLEIFLRELDSFSNVYFKRIADTPLRTFSQTQVSFGA